MSSTLAWSLGAIIVIVLLVAASLPPLLQAGLAGGFGEVDLVARMEKYQTDAQEAIDTYQAGVNGRSMFFTPLPTPRRPQRTTPPPPRPEPTRRETVAPTQTEPMVPPTYTGPSLMAIFGEEVWFTGSGFKGEILRIKTGTEANGIEVVSTDPPWMATLKYRGGEYEVPLYKRNTELFVAEAIDATPPPGLTEQPPAAADDPPPVDEKPAQPGISGPKSSVDPVEKRDMRSSTTGNGSSRNSSHGLRESASNGSDKDSAGVP
jgi:hypothetical protein